MKISPFPKPITLPSGGRLNGFGQLITTGATDMVDPRNGAPKRTAFAPHTPGMRSRTNMAPPESAVGKSYEKTIPLHSSTTARQRAAVHPGTDAATILAAAENCGRKE